MSVFNGGLLAVASTGVNESLPLEIADLEGNQIFPFQDTVFLCTLLFLVLTIHTDRTHTYIYKFCIWFGGCC